MDNVSEIASSHATAPEEVVWDPWVRIGHWTLVLCVAYALFAKRKFPGHDVAGYLIVAVVLWRWVWGFVGSRYARFSAFLYSPRETRDYLLAAVRLGKAKEYMTHNPMGALMVFCLLVMLPGVSVLGMMLIASQQLAGPLAGWVPVAWDHTLETLHGFAAWSLAALVAVHLLGTAWATWWHRENYVKAMITGKKPCYKRRQHRGSAADRRN